jgi:PAS domain S-box-containing protein
MLPRETTQLSDPPGSLDEALATLHQLAVLGAAFETNGGAAPGAHLTGGPDDKTVAQARYQSLIEQIPAVTFLASLSGGQNQLYVSPQIESLLGFTQDEWLSEPILWYRQTHPEDRDRVSMAFAASCATGEPFRDVFRVLTQAGETVWVHAQAQLVRDERGELLFLQGVGFDVTEQYRGREAREQLIQEQAARAEADRERHRLREIFTHLPAAVVLLSGENHCVEFMNPVAVELAVTGEGALGRPYAEAFPDLARHLLQAFDTTRTTGATFSAPELSVSSPLWPDQHFFNVFCQSLEDARGRFLLVHAVDVTEQTRARQEVEAALNLRDEFLSIASHELKTPIAALTGQAELVQRRLERNIQLEPQQIQRALATILRQSGRLTQLVTQLLDVSRFEAGKLAIDPQPGDLALLVEQVVDRARMMTQRHQITLDAPPHIAAVVDELRLEQVLTNLVDNAIKYSPAGGAIKVTLREAPPGWAELSVRDHGLGIPPERRHHIFERFYQAHEGGHRIGLGLGLYISRQIVQLHGGSIEPEFPADGGTRFVVRLPLANRAPSLPTG